jgi:hypothetical protein
VKTQILIGLAALGLLACEEAAEDIMPQLIADAGELVRDAGQAIADAGEALHDATTADAQTDSGAPKGRRVLESACDQVRTVSGLPGGTVEQHFASFDVDANDVRSVWLCDTPTQSPLDCPTGAAGVTCTGATPPKAKCNTASGYEGEDGQLWIVCGAYGSARVVLD